MSARLLILQASCHYSKLLTENPNVSILLLKVCYWRPDYEKTPPTASRPIKRVRPLRPQRTPDPLDLLRGHLASCCDGSMCVELLSHDSTSNKLRPMWALKEVSRLSSLAAMRHQSVRASDLVQPSLRVPPSALTPVSALRDIASLPCAVSLYLLVAVFSCTSSVFHELDAL
jgi:hypothetical protein